MAIDPRQIPRQPAVDRSLIQRARRSHHRRHDDQQQRQNEHRNEQVGDDHAALDDARQRQRHARPVIDGGVRHAAQSQRGLECQRNEREDRQAQQPRRDDRLIGVAGGVLEFAHVADCAFEAVGRPAGAEQARRQQRQPGGIPAAEADMARRIAHDRQQRKQMVGRQIARHDRHQSDQQQRAEADERQHLLRAGRARRALMLQQEGHEQEPGGDDRDRIDPQRQPGFDGAQIEQREVPRIDRRIRREQAGQDVTGGQPRAQRQDRRPGEPIAPDGHGRDELAIFDPGRRAIHRGAAGLVGIQAGDFGIDEALQEADQHRDDPDRPGRLPDHGGNAAHRQQHAGRNAADRPERPSPIQRTQQRRARRSACGMPGSDPAVARFRDHHLVRHSAAPF